MLDNESSLRFNLLRFPLIVGVVFIHAYSSTAVFAGAEVGVVHPHLIVDFVRNFISQGIARVAVPAFFLISGYLFFAGFKWSKENYLKKLKNRTKTLLIPFLFWNIITLLLIAIIGAIPATQTFLSGKNPLITSFNFFDYLNAIIGINQKPIAYQFWFIRDLIVLVLLAPLIYIVNRFVALPFLGLVLICWLMDIWPVYIPSSAAFLYFSVGAYLASINKNVFCLDKYGSAIVILYLSIVTIDVLFINQPFHPYLLKIGIVFGVLAALFSTKFVMQKEKLRLFILRLSSASFFVFAIHEPLLTILKKITYKAISPELPVTILVLYFFIPIVTIFLAIVIYRGFLAVSPRFASIVTGGR